MCGVTVECLNTGGLIKSIKEDLRHISEKQSFLRYQGGINKRSYLEL